MLSNPREVGDRVERDREEKRGQRRRREGTRKGGEKGDLIRAGSGTLTVVVEEDKHGVSASKESELAVHNVRWSDNPLRGCVKIAQAAVDDTEKFSRNDLARLLG